MTLIRIWPLRIKYSSANSWSPLLRGVAVVADVAVVEVVEVVSHGMAVVAVVSHGMAVMAVMLHCMAVVEDSPQGGLKNSMN